MRITALEVDGYGVWTGLKFEPLSEGLNVFFGPNEAGKTTLMQFVRSVLYGFSPSAAAICLRCTAGGPAGRWKSPCPTAGGPCPATQQGRRPSSTRNWPWRPPTARGRANTC